ncbi:Calx-beta domain-containing protein [Methanooceanicella nereidis]|nr:Calx-beta domain-containing protein [Methanocella sp. CWC-04]
MVVFLLMATSLGTAQIVNIINGSSSDGPDGLSLLGATSLPIVNFKQISYVAGENRADGYIEITVRLNQVPTQRIAVHYDLVSAGTTATENTDFTLESTKRVVFGASGDTATEKTFRVYLIDDSRYEGDETVQLKLRINSANEDKVVLGNKNVTTITITDVADRPRVMFDRPSYNVNVNEGIGTLTLNVVKDGETDLPSSVNYRTLSGMALQGQDFAQSSGTLTFGPTGTTASINVTINEDSIFEVLENFTVELYDPVDARIGWRNPASVWITDNDTAPVVQFRLSSYTFDENDGTVQVTVTKTGETSMPASVDYATANGGAEAGQDYASTSGTLTFDASEYEKAFSLGIIDDGVYELSEFFYVNLSGPVNATLGSADSAQINIADDDDAPEFTFSASSYDVNEDAGTVTINVTKSGETRVSASVNYTTADGTALAGSDYAAASGTLDYAWDETWKTFTVDILNNGLYEGNELFYVNLADAVNAEIATQTSQVNIIEDDPIPVISFSEAVYNVNENGVSIDIEVIMDNEASEPVTVDYATYDITAVSPADYQGCSGTLTFETGEHSQSFTVLIQDDSVYEGLESIGLALSGPSANSVLGSQVTAQIDITENDAYPTFGFNRTGYNVKESDASVTLKVLMFGEASMPITINYGTMNGTAVYEDDYNRTSGHYTFNPGESEKTFTVAIHEDSVWEGDERFSAILVDTIGNNLNSTEITILENDPHPPPVYVEYLWNAAIALKNSIVPDATPTPEPSVTPTPVPTVSPTPDPSVTATPTAEPTTTEQTGPGDIMVWALLIVLAVVGLGAGYFLVFKKK